MHSHLILLVLAVTVMLLKIAIFNITLEKLASDVLAQKQF